MTTTTDEPETTDEPISRVRAALVLAGRMIEFAAKVADRVADPFTGPGPGRQARTDLGYDLGDVILVRGTRWRVDSITDDHVKLARFTPAVIPARFSTEPVTDSYDMYVTDHGDSAGDTKRMYRLTPERFGMFCSLNESNPGRPDVIARYLETTAGRNPS